MPRLLATDDGAILEKVRAALKASGLVESGLKGPKAVWFKRAESGLKGLSAVHEASREVNKSKREDSAGRRSAPVRLQAFDGDVLSPAVELSSLAPGSQ